MRPPDKDVSRAFHFTGTEKGRKGVSFPAIWQSQSPPVRGSPVGLFFDDELKGAYRNGLVWPSEGNGYPAAITMSISMMAT